MVDAMSGFGAKTPLRDAIYRDDYYYNSAKDVIELLSRIFENDDAKVYELLEEDDVIEERTSYNKDEQSFGIKGTRALQTQPTPRDLQGERRELQSLCLSPMNSRRSSHSTA